MNHRIALFVVDIDGIKQIHMQKEKKIVYLTMMLSNVSLKNSHEIILIEFIVLF